MLIFDHVASNSSFLFWKFLKMIAKLVLVTFQRNEENNWIIDIRSTECRFFLLLRAVEYFLCPLNFTQMLFLSTCQNETLFLLQSAGYEAQVEQMTRAI